MEYLFYKIPIITSDFGRKNSLKKSSISDSVKQNIKLLLNTLPLRNRFDPNYGCNIQKAQFLASKMSWEGTSDEDLFKKKARENISELLKKYEKRIAVQDIEVNIQYRDKTIKQKNTDKYLIKVDVYIKYKIKSIYKNDSLYELDEFIYLV